MTGGDLFISEIYFVTTRPLYNQGFGGDIGSMRDPELEIRVKPRAFGTYSFKVTDAVKFVLEFVGQTGAADPNRAMDWVRDQLMMGVRTTLTSLIRDGEMTMMDFGTAGPDVARSIVAECPDLAKIGVQVLEIAKLNLNLSEEDQDRIDEFQDQIVQAKIDARKAKIAVSQAGSEAAQRQFELDQEYQNRARYMQNLNMAQYQQFAQAEAMMGMGEGMSGMKRSRLEMAGESKEGSKSHTHAKRLRVSESEDEECMDEEESEEEHEEADEGEEYMTDEEYMPEEEDEHGVAPNNVGYGARRGAVLRYLARVHTIAGQTIIIDSD